MTKIITGNFAADGSSEEFLATKLTYCAGDTTATDFGGGTLTLEVSQTGENFTTDNAITAEGVYTSIDYAGGMKCKLTLAGATSPDLNYSIKYE